MLALEKFIASFLSLPGLFFVLVFILTLYLIANARGLYIKLLSVFTLVLMYLTFTVLGSAIWLFPLEHKYDQPETYNNDYPVVVLGGGINYLGKDKGELNSITLQRLYRGYQLFRRIKSQLVFTGGVAVGHNSQLSEARLAAEWLESMGVDIEHIVLEEKARTTYENGLHVSKWLAANQKSGVYLVTSAVHLPRAVAVFERQGIKVIPVPAGYLASRQVSWLDFLPNRGALSANLAAIHEWVGIIWYKLTGRI